MLVVPSVSGPGTGVPEPYPDRSSPVADTIICMTLNDQPSDFCAVIPLVGTNQPLFTPHVGSDPSNGFPVERDSLHGPNVMFPGNVASDMYHQQLGVLNDTYNEH